MTDPEKIEFVKRLLDNGIDACLRHECMPGCIFCKLRDDLEAEDADVDGL